MIENHNNVCSLCQINDNGKLILIGKFFFNFFDVNQLIEYLFLRFILPFLLSVS